MSRPSIEKVQQWFGFDYERGVLIRKLKTSDALSDEVPPDKRCYFRGKRYPYSHIVWVVCKDKWPDEFIDHKNHDQLDFHIDNLREADGRQNQHNKRMNNHFKGVAFDGSVPRRKPWIAGIMVDCKSIFLGSYETQEEAAEAYRQAALKYHGEFACLE